MLVRVGGHRAAQGIQRFRSGRLLPSTENKSKARQHSRRSAADCCSLTRGPTHSTTLLALPDVQRIAQNLGDFCQNLAKKPWRLLPESCPQNAIALAKLFAKKLLKNHAKMVAKPLKSMKMAKNAPRSKKIAPRSGNEPKKCQA